MINKQLKMKKMKSRRISLLLATVLAITTLSASVVPSKDPLCGIYQTANDFAQKKLIHPIYSIDKKNHLALHAMFGSNKIDVVDAGVKASYLRSEIYGYKENGVDYRIVGDNAYTIVDAASFVIYSNVKTIAGMKGHDTKETVYYFSKDATSVVKQLTKENLKAEFADNSRFRYYLDAFFKSDKDLIAFDAQAKEYKVKFVYETSLKEGVQAKNVYKPML